MQPSTHSPRPDGLNSSRRFAQAPCSLASAQPTDRSFVRHSRLRVPATTLIRDHTRQFTLMPSGCVGLEAACPLRRTQRPKPSPRSVDCSTAAVKTFVLLSAPETLHESGLAALGNRNVETEIRTSIAWGVSDP